MLINKVVDENSIDTFDEFELLDVCSEYAVNIERSYSEFMLEQAKDEFKQYVNEGIITESIDSIKAKLSKLVEKIKEILNKLKDKVLKILKDYNTRSIAYFNKNKDAIEKGASLVNDFTGYEELKDFNYLKSSVDSLKGELTDAIHNLNNCKGDNEIKEFMKKYNNVVSYVPSLSHMKKVNIKYTFNELENIFNDDYEFGSYKRHLENIIEYCDYFTINSTKESEEKYSNTFIRANNKLLQILSNSAKEYSKLSVKVLAQGFKYMKAAVNAALNN